MFSWQRTRFREVAVLSQMHFFVYILIFCFVQKIIADLLCQVWLLKPAIHFCQLMMCTFHASACKNVYHFIEASETIYSSHALWCLHFELISESNHMLRCVASLFHFALKKSKIKLTFGPCVCFNVKILWEEKKEMDIWGWKTWRLCFRGLFSIWTMFHNSEKKLGAFCFPRIFVMTQTAVAEIEFGQSHKIQTCMNGA